ncbi:MAG TPA: RNA polymerase sigma factor SigM [Mycobacteriales bacterium]|nr:RNA polymerase sigma factor SigM [Mycobacteriales bacterium]
MKGTSRASDIDLLRRHVAGDSDAFGELVARHRDRVWAVAMRVLGDRQEAEDAVQDAFLSALRGAASFRGEAAVTTWLHRITLNACLDRVRKRKPTLPLDPTDAGLPAHVIAVPADSDRVPDVLDVTRALAQLSPDAREVLLLVDVEDRPVAEVAERLGVAIGTVKSRCWRARARLAVLLGVVTDVNTEVNTEVNATVDATVDAAAPGNRAGAADVGSTGAPDEPQDETASEGGAQ